MGDCVSLKESKKQCGSHIREPKAFSPLDLYYLGATGGAPGWPLCGSSGQQKTLQPGIVTRTIQVIHLNYVCQGQIFRCSLCSLGSGGGAHLPVNEC